ncbi:hypothetical protein YC2023_105855 [Brassica napus]
MTREWMGYGLHDHHQLTVVDRNFRVSVWLFASVLLRWMKSGPHPPQAEMIDSNVRRSNKIRGRGGGIVEFS